MQVKASENIEVSSRAERADRSIAWPNPGQEAPGDACGLVVGRALSHVGDGGEWHHKPLLGHCWDPHCRKCWSDWLGREAMRAWERIQLYRRYAFCVGRPEESLTTDPSVPIEYIVNARQTKKNLQEVAERHVLNRLAVVPSHAPSSVRELAKMRHEADRIAQEFGAEGCCFYSRSALDTRFQFVYLWPDLPRAKQTSGPLLQANGWEVIQGAPVNLSYESLREELSFLLPPTCIGQIESEDRARRAPHSVRWVGSLGPRAAPKKVLEGFRRPSEAPGSMWCRLCRRHIAKVDLHMTVYDGIETELFAGPALPDVIHEWGSTGHGMVGEAWSSE